MMVCKPDLAPADSQSATPNPEPEPKEWVAWASSFSALDPEVAAAKSPGSEDLAKRLADRALGKGMTLASEVSGHLAPRDDSLAEFLGMFLAASVKALGRGKSRGTGTAGAIYLYEERFNELVMAASNGFPMVVDQIPGRNKTDNAYVDWNTDRLKVYPEKTTTNGIYHDKSLYIRLCTLRELQNRLGAQARATPGPRHDWTREELELDYTQHADSGTPAGCIDCNKLLVGVAAYYPTESITGKLFDAIQGPELDRLPLNAGNRKEMIALDQTLKMHLSNEYLSRRTIWYATRDDMPAGRQVKAGVYEGLQFPYSNWVGPFMGCALRFAGEHMGILKVEKWRDPTQYKREPIKWKRANVDYLRMYSYILAACLYFRKHATGEDFSCAWTQRQPAAGGRP